MWLVTSRKTPFISLANRLLGFFEGDEHDIYETDILTLPHSIDIIWKGQHKGLCRCYRDSKIQRMGWKGEKERGREEEWGHLLWPRQGINKQTGCQTISTPTEQTGRLTNLDHIYGQASHCLDRCNVETTHRRRRGKTSPIAFRRQPSSLSIICRLCLFC